ncbi:MAG TPA: ABC transporter substrate-binding protein [Stellaceae bacterium]|nr:ABC transporter substrate-binding protein [Stellaceae bacterium]
MAKTISRRDALTALGGSLALLGMPAAKAAENTLPVVRVGVIPIFAVAPHYAAIRFGYYAAEGITTTSTTVRGGAVGIPGLVSGTFDILYSNCISTLTALERGIDLRVVAEATTIPTHPPDVDALFKRKGENLHSGKDLEGKVIAINAKYDLMWLVMQGWIQKTGGDANKVTYREVPVPSMIDALKHREVDAALVLDPFMTLGLGDPALEVLGWPSSTIMPGLPSSLWITSGRMADAKPDLIRAWARGFAKGVAWFNAHIGDADFIDLVAGYSKTDRGLLAKMYTAKQPTQIDLPIMEKLVGVVKDYGLIKTDIDIASKIFKT